MSNALVKLCIDTYRGSLGKYSQDEANEVIRKALLDKIGVDKFDWKAYRRNKNEIFEIMEEVLDTTVPEGIIGNNKFFEEFVEYRDLGWGDTNRFYVEDDVPVLISKIADGTGNLRRQRLNAGETFTVETFTYGAKVYEELYRFLAGRVDFAKLVQKINDGFNEKIALDIFNSFENSFSSLPATFAVTGSYSEDQLINLIQHVEAANGHQQAKIIGTKNALRKVTTGTVSEKLKEELNYGGFYGVFNGTPMFELKQYHKTGTFDFALNDNQLYVIAGSPKPIKFITEGETIIQEDVDGKKQDMSIDYLVTKKMGVATIITNYYGIYKMS